MATPLDYSGDHVFLDGVESGTYTAPDGTVSNVTVLRDHLRRAGIAGALIGVSSGDVPFFVWGLDDVEVNATLTVSGTVYTVIEATYQRSDRAHHRLICREHKP